MYDYARSTGDVEFIEASWESLKRAFEWCLSKDINKDGLMDNKEAGLGALEYGALTGIATDIYLAAVWVRAAYSMQFLADMSGDQTYAKEAAARFRRARQAFDRKFWDEENQFYAYAFNADGELVKEISPWNALGMMWGWGTEKRSQISLKRLCSAELSTDWGVRSISDHSRYFQPLNYNYGAVWPFLTSWVTAALFKHHMPLQGYSLLMSTANHTFDHALGCVTEVFSGTHNVWPQEAVSHQGFSTAGVVLPFVRGLLGIEGNALKKTLTFSPHFPADWGHVSLENCRVGQAGFWLDYERHENKISVNVKNENANGYTFLFSPAMGIGTQITSLSVNGRAWDFQTREKSQVILVEAEIPVDEGAMQIEMEYVPAVEILPAIPKTHVGDSNKGLKILSVEKNASKLTIQVEGLAGNSYVLRITKPEKIDHVEGGAWEKDKIVIAIPDGKEGEFISHTLTLHTR
jgi:hypothetical protein